MLTIHLMRSLCFRQNKIIPTLTAKQHYLFNSKETNSNCHAYKTINFFTPCRQFSLVGFYTAVAQSTPVMTFQNALLDLHQLSGLPWWVVIALSTLSIRTLIVFPLAVHQNQVVTRLANINVEMGKLAPELNKEVNIARVMYKWDDKHCKRIFRKQLREIYNGLILRDNCHPFKTILLGLIQIPVWICFSFSLRNLTMMSVNIDSAPDSLQCLKTEGFLWFPDLTCPDPIVIPIVLFIVNLSLIEVHALRSVGKGTLLQKVLLNSSRIIIAVVAALASINPSSVSFYWLCSSTYGLLQNILLMSPKVRRALNIPTTDTESPTPFKDIATNFKNRFNK